MLIEVQHPSFKTQRLAVETAGWYRGPKLLVNSVPAQKTKGSYIVRNDLEIETTIQLKYNLLDPIPKVKINEETLELASPLKWYEYACVGLPLILVFTGGALGGLIGAISANASGKVFRGDRSLFAKYSLSVLISLGGLITFIIVATIVQLFVGAPHK